MEKGLKKDEALRAAKLTYLNSVSKSKAHPYYWSAFVQFGDVSAMQLKQSFNYIYLLLGLALMLAIGMFVAKTKST